MYTLGKFDCGRDGLSNQTKARHKLSISRKKTLSFFTIFSRSDMVPLTNSYTRGVQIVFTGAAECSFYGNIFKRID